MRFYADGPAIPDELLSLQREGNTIFFCGAGISMPAGLPGFGGLTKEIIDSLNSTRALEPFRRNEYDRAFTALFREFGRPEIDKQLFKALRAPKKANLARHVFLLHDERYRRSPRLCPQISRSDANGPERVDR